ncbi:hypothetical protein [Microbispora sp. GKU 823]|uniref:hypothetical protein n=1 Tax=Microbispora sp. GKU 823 TaxID=1652100 RepID=UPI0009A25C45|nr:hypothetical protein [Microbispora sp. GKU 823]OPG14323.1 hypothetical protein B1L11_03305 [Microbispora sp. GKU 823]
MLRRTRFRGRERGVDDADPHAAPGVLVAGERLRHVGGAGGLRLPAVHRLVSQHVELAQGHGLVPEGGELAAHQVHGLVAARQDRAVRQGHGFVAVPDDRVHDPVLADPRHPAAAVGGRLLPQQGEELADLDGIVVGVLEVAQAGQPEELVPVVGGEGGVHDAEVVQHALDDLQVQEVDDELVRLVRCGARVDWHLDSVLPGVMTCPERELPQTEPRGPGRDTSNAGNAAGRKGPRERSSTRSRRSRRRRQRRPAARGRVAGAGG